MARATNAIVQTNGNGIEKKEKFSEFITGPQASKLIASAIPDAASKARFIGSIVSAVSATPALQECTPASVLAAGLRGEGEGLILGIGYYIVPYKPNAVFTRSYKGYIQLALAGGDVADMDCVEVREGEYIGRNKRTKRPEFDFSIYETDEEAEKHPIVGYYAYCEKKDGYFRGEYMSLNAVMEHCERYSPKNFNRKNYLRLISGELDKESAERLMDSSAYYKNPEAMFKKTVLRKLLNSGYVTLAASTRLNAIMDEDDETNAVAEALGSFDVVNVDSETGELREQSVGIAPDPAPTHAENPAKAPGTDDKPEGLAAKKRGRPAKQQATEQPAKMEAEAIDADYEEVPTHTDSDVPPDDADAVMADFFGGAF